MFFRTDMAVERRDVYKAAIKNDNIDGIESYEEIEDEYKLTFVKITNENGEKAIGKKQGDYITIDLKRINHLSEDDLMMAAIEAGAEDFEAEEEVYQITTAPNDFTAVTEELEKLGLKFLEAGVQQVPSTYVALDEHGSERMQKLIDSLEDLDDVIEVFHNWEE